MKRFGTVSFGRLLLVALAASSLAARAPDQSPADLYGPLFEAVQSQKIFPDGKTFVDARPKRPPARILADYRAHAAFTDAELKRFVTHNFDVPESVPAPPPSQDRTTL